MENEKWEVQITDTVKIQQHDNYNFTILKKSKGSNRRTGEVVESYKILGYYSSLRLAILALLDKDVLVDLDEVKSLRDYAQATRRQYQLIKDLLEGTYE